MWDEGIKIYIDFHRRSSELLTLWAQWIIQKKCEWFVWKWINKSHFPIGWKKHPGQNSNLSAEVANILDTSDRQTMLSPFIVCVVESSVDRALATSAKRSLVTLFFTQLENENSSDLLAPIRIIVLKRIQWDKQWDKYKRNTVQNALRLTSRGSNERTPTE